MLVLPLEIKWALLPILYCSRNTEFPAVVVLKFWGQQNHMEGLINHRLLSSALLIHQVWGGAREFAFLTGSQVMQQLLAQIQALRTTAL